ncbi:hypothetical protein PSHI8_05500 [Polynucleobacter sp. SHI8]|uniref:DUF934 domain-containing protein n=1 Tax=unclassified Polynucleobacter TaxID=2640945 RepID=UPI002493251B|nr:MULTISPECIES: DUF934 domain-containing protein [unclassified Polynucleobacter]BDW10468.1 hypothetical protein PSHI2_05500 [Polynucleobacter sp. SHI2]BDW12914.1 hypothetical protein PSHI8_05500 [Polynucleobacter sp. SHI8]
MSKYIEYPKSTEPTIGKNAWVVSKDESLAIESLPEGRVIVSFTYWKEHQASLKAKVDRKEVGIFFTVDDDIVQESEVIQSAMSAWGVIAIDFPIFRDGRGFSTAAILREQFHWEHELRAIGDVLIDQLVQMARVGFDAFVLREDQSLETALIQLKRFPVKMQNDWRSQRTILQGVAA